MGKSEYFEVRKVEGEVEQPQIIIDAEAIYDLLLRAELMMKSLQSGSSTVTTTMTDDASRPTKATSTMIFSYVNTDSSLTS